MKSVRLLLVLALASFAWALQGDYCDDPFVIDTLPVAGLAGNNTGFANDFSMDLSCTGETTLGPDVVYEYTTEVAGEYSAFLALSAPWNGAMYVLTDCFVAVCMAGADDYGIMSPEVVVFDMPANTTFWVVVDGRAAGDMGTYYFGLQGPPTAVQEEGDLVRSGRFVEITPNPFLGTAGIRFGIENSGPVEVAIYSQSGARVTTLFDGACDEGQHELTWNGRDDAGTEVTEGVYFLMLRTQDRESVRKVVLLK
jgi:hypothetical protein